MEHVIEFLKSLPNSKLSNDGRQLTARCPLCGDNPENPRAAHFNIRIDISHGEGLVFQCFRPSCRYPTGVLQTDNLQLMGCHDMRAILELVRYNEANKRYVKDKKLKIKIQRKHTTSNPMTEWNKNKLKYLEDRLGHIFDSTMLRKYRIQLSLYDYTTINSIHKFAFDKNYCDMINKYTIGFVSTYKDYIIFRDLTKKGIFSQRYINYRIMGEIDDNDKKFYTIPFDIDLLDPQPVVINVAEGIFSILGVHLNTEIDREFNSQIFGAPCGTGYYYLIYHLVRQYGMTYLRVNIFSDSEIKLDKYKKLLTQLLGFCRLESLNVYYNDTKEDFGHKKENILIRKHTLYKEEW